MKILAFDTSTRFLSVALLENGELKSGMHEEAGIAHSEMLVPGICGLLDSTGWKSEDIELICTGIGPGSFTGLRIAVATAKGFAAALGTKVLGVPTMDAVVMRPGIPDGCVAPLFDARKGKVYTRFYEHRGGEAAPVSEHLLLTIAEVLDALKGRVTFFGEAVGLYSEELTAHPLATSIEGIDWYPRAADIGIIGYKRAGLGTDDPRDLDPIYLHAKEANITNRKR